MKIKNLLILLITIGLVPQTYAQYTGGSRKDFASIIPVSEIGIKPLTAVIQLLGRYRKSKIKLNYTNNSQQFNSL